LVPKGAVIRTLFKDYAPEELAGGATLFHEHLSSARISASAFAPHRPPCSRRKGYPRPTPPRESVACLVDAGLEGAGMDLEFIRAVAMKSEMSRVERKVFRAVGKAHLETNLWIFTHTGIPVKAAIEQLDIFEGRGCGSAAGRDRSSPQPERPHALRAQDAVPARRVRVLRSPRRAWRRRGRAARQGLLDGAPGSHKTGAADVGLSLFPSAAPDRPSIRRASRRRPRRSAHRARSARARRSLPRCRRRNR
jgi:hypothetical protein